MKDWQSQAHLKWDCKYHAVIIRVERFGKKRIESVE